MTSSTPSALRAILDAPGHVLVEAGPGAGKTHALVAKVLAELGLDPDTPRPAPLALEAVVAITFTRKAAAELRGRLRGALLARARAAQGADRERWAQMAFAVEQARIGTIDALAIELIREHGALIGLDQGAELVSGAEARPRLGPVLDATLAAAVASADPGATFLVRQFGYAGVVGLLHDVLERPDRLRRSLARAATGVPGQGLGWASLQDAAGRPLGLSPADRHLEPLAEAALRFLGVVDDAVWAAQREGGWVTLPYALVAAALLAREPAVVSAFAARTRLVCVDEHQDTSRLQAQMLFHLTGLIPPAGADPSAETSSGTAASPGLRTFFVGDPKQSIYGFRNADITMWARTQRLMIEHDGRIVHLADNWRSHPRLVAFTDATFGRLFNDGRPADRPLNPYERVYRPLVPRRAAETPGGRVTRLVTPARDVPGTAAAIAAHIRRLLDDPAATPVMERTLDGGETTRALEPRDIAVLARSLGALGEPLARELRRRGVPVATGATRMLSTRPEARDLVAAVRAVLAPDDPALLVTHLRSPLAGVSDAVLALAAVTPEGSAGPAPLARDGRAFRARLRAAGDPAATDALRLLERWAALVDRVPTDDLLRLMVADTHYRAVLAGGPEPEVALRAVDRVIEWAGARAPSLTTFVSDYDTLVAAAAREEEGALGSSSDRVTLTTVHAAKGLEWPVVILAGLDEGVVRPVRPDAPVLSDLGGLVLPTEVVATDGEGVEPSAVWTRVAHDTLAREYAEARRVFFVGVTRARDHLVLAGSWADRDREGEPVAARGLTSRPEWQHRDTVDRWLRWIYPGLVASGDRERRRAGVTVRDTRGAVPLELQVLEPEPDADALVGLAGGTPGSDGWLLLHDAPGAAGAGPVAERAAPPVLPYAGPVDDLSPLRRTWTASELLQFETEPWRHWWGYRQSLSQTVLALDPEGAIAALHPSERGAILHEYLRHHQAGWSPEERRARMRSVLLRRLPLAHPAADPAVDRLLQHVAGYEASGVADRLRRAAVVRHEVPFLVSLGAGLRLEGKIDVLWQDVPGGAWHLLDFKSAQIGASGDAVGPILDAETRQYEIQAAVYAIAARRLLPGVVDDFTFLYTDHGLTRVLPIADAWVESWTARIHEIVARIRANDYGPPPVYRAEVCRHCPFRRMCRPAGDPEAPAGASPGPPALLGPSEAVGRLGGVARLPLTPLALAAGPT